MPKCCVAECKSGTFKEVQTTRKAGLRPKSYFNFPKEENLRKQWQDIIFDKDEPWTNTYKICELHFKDSDIKKYDETVLKDGTIHRIQRHRYVLHSQAIPSRSIVVENHQAKEMAIKDNTDCNKNTKKIVLQNTIVRAGKNTKNKIQKNKKSASQNVPSIIKEEISIENFNLELNEDENPHIDKERIPTKVYSYNRTEKRKLESRKKPLIIARSQQKNRLEVIEKDKLNDDSMQCNAENLSENTTENSDPIERQNESLNENSVEARYEFNQLINDLQNRALNMSSSWAYIITNNTAVTFVHVHPLKFVIHLFCVIDINMNVEISTSDRRVNLNVDEVFHSSTDFELYLSKLERTKCCEGTGVKNTFSRNCQGFISSVDEYKRSRGYQRCKFCKEYRMKMLKIKERAIETEYRSCQQNHQMKILKFKYAQLQKIFFKERKRYKDKKN